MNFKRHSLFAFAISLSMLTAITLQPVPIKANAEEPFAKVNTWTGFMLRDIANGNYLTVIQLPEQVLNNVTDFNADGVEAYNTWYFTEAENGYYTLKSATNGGMCFLTFGEKSLLKIKETTGSSDQYFGLVQVSNKAYKLYAYDGELVGTYALEPVTGLKTGDVDRNGEVNTLDLSLAKYAVSNSSKVSFAVHAIADINNDGTVDASDLKILQNYILKKEELANIGVNLPQCTIYPEIEIENDNITIADLPAEYKSAADWIWENRIVRENSTGKRNTIFDQIVAGKGTLNFVVRWQSYKSITLEQRKELEKKVEESVNSWANYLVGYEDWPYSHVDVKIVGWAVLDRSCLLDLQPDEIVYDTLISDYDSQYDTSNGIEIIPDKLPSAPAELSRFDHFYDENYEYPGGLDKRFDMYIWATQGFPSIGGCGGDWGQRLSDDAYLNIISGSGLHVLTHEIGHGFGITDFYGGEGELDGFPPGGFPGGGNSIMMAGSSMEITDFDGWLLRYMWSQIHDEDGRFKY